MSTLYKPHRYSSSLRETIETLPPNAVEIANRWLREWPQQTRMLLQQPERYLQFLREQAEAEQAAYTAENLREMPRHAIARIYRIRRSPPRL